MITTASTTRIANDLFVEHCSTNKEKLPRYTGEPPEAIPFGHTASIKHIFSTHCILTCKRET